MADFSQYWWSDSGAAPGGIGNSLRFRGAQDLLRTATVESNKRTFTYSTWVKRSNTTESVQIFNQESPSNSTHRLDLYFMNSGPIEVYNYNGSYQLKCITDAVFRDPSAWYHIVLRVDTTQATANDRVRLYVNGVQQTFSTNDQPAQNFETYVNSVSPIRIGRMSSPPQFLDGYLAEVHFIDGQALDPTDFGEFDNNGVWIPTPYAGTYGTNGFYLDFSDPADIGADRSGNDNDFTPNGFELGDNTSELWDHMVDFPTRNFATLNPLDLATPDEADLDNANLKAGTSVNANTSSVRATQAFNAGRWYFETFNLDAVATEFGAGWADKDLDHKLQSSDAGVFFYTMEEAEITGFAIDFENRAIWTSNEGVWNLGATEAEIIAGDTTNARFRDIDPDLVLAPIFLKESTSFQGRGTFNFGQQPFRFNPPAGFEPLQTQNLPAAPIPNGRDHFRAITDTGANILTAAQTAFPNGLWWIKDRDNTNQHQLAATILDANQAIVTPQTNPNSQDYVAPDGNSVAWCWNCPDAFTPAVSETLVSARRNVGAGFSMVRLTSSGGSSSETYEHGLNAAPDFIMMTRISPRNSSWMIRVWMPEFAASGNNAGLRLNDDTPLLTNIDQTKPTAVNATTVTYSSLSSGTGDLAAFNWTAVPGYSAFGSYEGNDDLDGPFIYTGFRPALVITKGIDSAGNWYLKDTTRSLTNPVTWELNTDNELGDHSNGNMDCLSNGFKLRNTNSSQNAAETYIYAAFAENPFGGNNVAPANAR